MRIAGLQKSSLLDYPSKIAAVVFTPGCNFACGYCHNPDILTAPLSNRLIEETAVFSFLEKRIGKLDAVVVSGGEPTLQKDLEGFIKKVKDLGFLVKLDTNGTNPDMVKNLCSQGLLDYIAMDVKAPLKKYSLVTCKSIDTDIIAESIDFIMNSDVDYEFRTTVVKSQLEKDDFEEIGRLLKGAKRYYLQKFVPSHTLDPAFAFEKTYTDEEFEKIKKILKKYIKEVFVR